MKRGPHVLVDGVHFVGSTRLAHPHEVAFPGGQVQLGQILLLDNEQALRRGVLEVARALGFARGRRRVEDVFDLFDEIRHCALRLVVAFISS